MREFHWSSVQAEDAQVERESLANRLCQESSSASLTSSSGRVSLVLPLQAWILMICGLGAISHDEVALGLHLSELTLVPEFE